MKHVVCTLGMLCTFAVGQIWFQMSHFGGVTLLVVWGSTMAALSYVSDPQKSSDQIDDDLG